MAQVKLLWRLTAVPEEYPLVCYTPVNESPEEFCNFVYLADTHDDTTLMQLWRRWIRQHVGSEPAS